MKKIGVMAILVVVLLSLGVAFAFENEPRGFRDLKWGDWPTKDMTILVPREYNKIEYIRPDENLNLGNAKLHQIVYCFYVVGEWERFICVFLHFRGKDNHRALENICRQKFGEPTQERLNQLIWVSQETGVILDYKFLDKRGTLMLADSRTLARYQEEQKKKHFEEAEKDW